MPTVVRELRLYARSCGSAAVVTCLLYTSGAYVGDLDAFYANCTTPVLFPVMLQQNFINNAQAIIDGSEDVAAAVAGVQSDLALYLAEQK